MSDAQYIEYRERRGVSYATNAATSGVMPVLDARRKAADDHERVLPEGLQTPGHYF